MKLLSRYRARSLLLAAMLPSLSATAIAESGDAADATLQQSIQPEAQAVIDRMTAALQGLQRYSIRAQNSRDEVLSYGYKLQLNESVQLTVQRPNKLRAEVSGDIRDRTIVYDGSRLAMYSPDDHAHVQLKAPDSLAQLVGGLLDAGIELPLVDVLYQGTGGHLTEAVRSGRLVGESTIDGVVCDHLAFRQSNVDWQLWVQQDEPALPRKVLITTRYALGDPQWQSLLTWNLNPTIDDSTFAFNAPQGSSEIRFVDPQAISGGAN
jgi:hypothetical protein